MFLNVNLETRNIEAYRVGWPYSIDWPVNGEPLSGSTGNSGGYEQHFKVYWVSDPRLIAKFMDARTNLAEMKAVFDESYNLIDIHVNYPDLGEDR